MTDLATARAADGSNFAHAEAGEVVVEHEFLAVFVDEAVNHLFVAAGAEGNGAHGLGFAAGEDGRAVNAGKDADFAGDRADAVIIATIGADAGEDCFAGDLLLDFDEDRADLLLLVARGDDGLIAGVWIGDGRGHLGHQVVANLFDGIGAVGLAGFSFDFADFVGDAGADGIDEAGIGLLDLADLGFAGLGHQFFDQADDFDDGLVAELDGVGDFIFFDLPAAELDHVDEMAGAGDDEIHLAVFELLDGGVQDELSLDAADADVGRGDDQGNVADGDGGAGGDAGEDVRIVFAVEGENVELNLNFIHEPLGEERTKRAVDEAGGEDFLVCGASFALHESAGEFSSGCAAFAVIDLKWEEIDSLAGLGAGDGSEND